MLPSGSPARERWNHNIHHHGVVLDAVPAGARRALDVGCGEGTLTRQLVERVPEVVGVDLHAPSIAAARSQPTSGVMYVEGDVLTHPFEPGSFDVVASVATLHHLDEAAGLVRMAELVRPGGMLAVVGLARPQLPRDLPVEAAAAVATRVHRLTKTYWEHPSPTVWPPPHTYDEVRALARQHLPGVRYRRHLLWRYSLVWTKPAS